MSFINFYFYLGVLIFDIILRWGRYGSCVSFVIEYKVFGDRFYLLVLFGELFRIIWIYCICREFV